MTTEDRLSIQCSSARLHHTAGVVASVVEAASAAASCRCCSLPRQFIHLSVVLAFSHIRGFVDDTVEPERRNHGEVSQGSRELLLLVESTSNSASVFFIKFKLNTH